MIKSWFNQFLGQVMNVVLCSLIMIVGGLPLITLFPTLVSLLGVVYFYDRSGQWASPFEAFRYFFKRHFLKSVCYQLLWLLVMGVGTLNLSLAASMPQGVKISISLFSVFLMGVTSLTMGNVLFGLLLSPQEKMTEQLRKSLLLVIIKLPQSILLILSVVTGGLMIMLVPQSMIIVIGLVFWGYMALEKNIWQGFLYLDKQ